MPPTSVRSPGSSALARRRSLARGGVAATTRPGRRRRRPPHGSAGDEPVTLRLGYFPNVTHAPALVGVEGGLFEENLGDNVKLETVDVQRRHRRDRGRVLAGALDASYIGPNPAINAFAQSDGEAIRIVSGATSGGAFLVVKPDEIKNAQGPRGQEDRVARSSATPRTSRSAPG